MSPMYLIRYCEITKSRVHTVISHRRALSCLKLQYFLTALLTTVDMNTL